MKKKKIKIALAQIKIEQKNAVGDSCCGKSKIVEPDGSTLIEASNTNEELLIATIDLEKVSETRAKIPYVNYSHL